MSQRSSPVLTTQSSRSFLKSQDATSKIIVLKNTLLEAGIELCSGDDPHILTQEQSLVVRDLENIFSSSATRLNEFVDGLKVLCSKEKYFKKALMVTNFSKHDSSSLSSASRQQKIEQDSIFRIFLKVSHLQKQAIEILLDKITLVVSETAEDTSWLRLLLNTLRYLSYHENAEELCVKLLELLEIATEPAQLEILDLIPEIVSDSQFAEIAKQLCQLMDEKDELTGAIIDCLNALNLDQEIRVQVQDIILAKILSGCSLKDFPILLTFLMTDCKSQNLVPTLFKIRNSLDNLMLSSSDKNKEKETCKILIFTKLQALTISPKTISEAWLNMISSIKSSQDHKPVDYLILFLLHTTAHHKRRIIEAIFRKRVQTGLLKINSLEKMFEKYLPQQLLKNYFNSIVEIGCSLMRASSDSVIVDFASTLFHTLFSHRYTEKVYQREILDNLIMLTGSSEKNITGSVLKVISSLLTFKDKLQSHAHLLLRLLEKLDLFDLKDAKEVFEILCTLTCGENAESISGTRDEIHMLIRKQLHSTKRDIKQRGIVAAVVMTRHLVSTTSEQDVSIHGSVSNVNSLPYGPVREAATLLELAKTCTTGSAELLGLYYDQLAAMLMPNIHFDNHFMLWLNETVTENFQSKYVTQDATEPFNDLEITAQYLLNRQEEMQDDAMAINIACLTLKNDPSVLLLAPHFRLLRLLHYRLHNKDLSTIDSLLGCAILMPKVEDVSYLDSDQVKQVADCLFHCLNWFREIVSGFITQTDKRLRAKVIRRLEEIIVMEQQLQECLGKCPSHKLPSSYFDCLTELYRQNTSPKKERKKSQPKKIAKSAATVHNNDETVSSTAPPTPVKQKASTKSSHADYQVHFREMDTDLVLLLKYPLKMENKSTQTDANNPMLTLDQLIFILTDFSKKLATLTKGRNIGLSHLNIVIPLHIISDGVVLLPSLNKHLDVLIKSINQLMEKAEGRLDSPDLFREESLKVKTCFGLILEVFHLIFGWSGFQNSSNLEVLKKLLISLRPQNSQTPHSANRLITDFINDLLDYTDHCLELNQAVNLIKIMETLYTTTSPNPDVHKKIVTASGKLLSKRWYNHKGTLDSGKVHNANIEALLKVYISSASVKTIYGLVGTLQDQVKSLETKEDSLDMLISINKQNLHIFYYVLCTALLDRIKTEIQSLTNSEHLNLWNNVALTMQGLMAIAKTHETRTILACFLKKSIGILKVFLSHGIPIMELTLKSRPDEVVAIFKAMQTSTRFLHHLCCHSKLTKDASLMAYVPNFKLTLETLVYRVKAVLVANNCSEAFWMGNLRNRDLHGDDILSQSTVVSEETSNNASDEELPDDDESDLDEGTRGNSVNGSISSEVFD